MKCDTAFELMTDPLGNQSQALAEHLNHCPRCRQMLDALSPALEFLTDAKATAGDSVTNYSNNALREEREPIITTEAVQIAQAAALRLAAWKVSRRERWWILVRTAARYSLAMSAGMLLVLGLWSLQEPEDAPADSRCRRHEANQPGTQWTADDLQSLVQSCAKCHHDGKEQIELRPGARLGNRPKRSWDWLAPLFDEQKTEYSPEIVSESAYLIADSAIRVENQGASA